MEKETAMEQERDTVLKEMKQKLAELKDKARQEKFVFEEYHMPEISAQRRMHYAGKRVDVNTLGTYQEEDSALLANFKRYCAASINIDDEADRGMYGKILDAASMAYRRYAELKQVEKKTEVLADAKTSGQITSGDFHLKVQELLREIAEKGEEAKKTAQTLERFFRFVASRPTEDDQEMFVYRLRSEKDFPEEFRHSVKELGIEWNDAVILGEKLHNHPPAITKALVAVDGFSAEEAKPFLEQKGTDAGFHVEDPYAEAFAVSNFDHAFQPLFSAEQVKMLREQRKGMYDMIFVDGTSAKELYGPKITADQDAKQRGSEMKMRIFADLLQGRHMEVSNGERFLPLYLRIELPGLKETIQARELEASWSEDRIQEMVDKESRDLMVWAGQMEEKMWGVISDAAEKHPDGIKEDEEIENWLNGLLEIEGEK